jgi:hypothetical protein
VLDGFAEQRREAQASKLERARAPIKQPTD